MECSEKVRIVDWRFDLRRFRGETEYYFITEMENVNPVKVRIKHIFSMVTRGCSKKSE